MDHHVNAKADGGPPSATTWLCYTRTSYCTARPFKVCVKHGSVHYITLRHITLYTFIHFITLHSIHKLHTYRMEKHTVHTSESASFTRSCCNTLIARLIKFPLRVSSLGGGGAAPSPAPRPVWFSQGVMEKETYLKILQGMYVTCMSNRET